MPASSSDVAPRSLRETANLSRHSRSVDYHRRKACIASATDNSCKVIADARTVFDSRRRLGCDDWSVIAIQLPAVNESEAALCR